MTTGGSASEITGTGRRRPRGAVRDGLVAAGLELARTGGPDAREVPDATRRRLAELTFTFIEAGLA